MRKFEVIAAVCSGKGKQMFNHGEAVNENQVNNADKLVADGFLKEITEAAAPVADAEAAATEDVAEKPSETTEEQPENTEKPAAKPKKNKK